MDLGMVVGGLLVGFIVGLTGMGGGALMTPMLVFFFGVNPLAAVSSDLVTSALMKPFGGVVHLRHGSVNLRLVGWLVLGSVPSAFAGVLLLRALGSGSAVDDVVEVALGVALVAAALAIVVKAYVTMARSARSRAGDGGPDHGVLEVVAQPLPTFVIGVVGGLVVGMTSVGSGSLMIIALLVVYPALQASQLVGTDLVQAVPLVAAAALGHLMFGDFHLDVAASLLVGSIPGVVLGARTSARAPGGIIRRALAIVLLASGITLLGAGTPVIAVVTAAAVVVGPFIWMGARRANGLPARPASSSTQPPVGRPERVAPDG